MRSTFTVDLLGGFEVRVDDARVALPPTCRRIIALLALAEGQTPRAEVLSLLWPGVERCRADGNLRTGLWRINRIAEGLIDGQGAALSLVEEVELPHRQAIAQLRRSLVAAEMGERFRCTTAYPALLPGWVEAWTTVPRERLRQLGLHLHTSRRSRPV